MIVQKRLPGSIAGYRTQNWSWRSILLFLLLPGTLLFAGCGSVPVATRAHQISSEPTSPALSPLHVTLTTFDGSYTLFLAIMPFRAGENTFDARVDDAHTNQTLSQVKIILYATMQDMPMGTTSLALAGKGVMSARGSLLNMAGDWALGITIQIGDQPLHKAGVRFSLPPG